MARAPARFRQLDITRALKGAREAGTEPKRFEVMPDGRLVLAFTEPAPATKEPATAVNPWDEAVSPCPDRIPRI